MYDMCCKVHVRGAKAIETEASRNIQSLQYMKMKCP